MDPINTDITQGIHALKQQLKTTWNKGNYADIARSLQPSAEEFLRRHPVRPGARVLDVACGAGQIALPAAQAGAEVYGIDIADRLIDQARRRAREAGLTIQFEVGDAESLPYPDNSFDLVYSVIGAMFAPRPERAASELKRVCRPGGAIIMANWTPRGFVGQFFGVVGRHMPPSDLMPSPLMWGDESHVRTRFGEDIAKLHMDTQFFEFRYDWSPFQVVDFYRRYFGPVKNAFDNLDEPGQKALEKDLVELWSEHNLAGDNGIYVRGEVLEIEAVTAA